MKRVSWIRATGAAGLVGVAFWTVKLATILVRGESGHWIDEAAFGIGLLGILIGATSFALQVTRGRVATAVGCLLALVAVFLLMPGLSNVSVALFGEDTFAGSEGGLVVLALLIAAAGVAGVRTARRSTGSRSAPVVA